MAQRTRLTKRLTKRSQSGAKVFSGSSLSESSCRSQGGCFKRILTNGTSSAGENFNDQNKSKKEREKNNGLPETTR